ncbi:ribosomal protein S5 domain 2-type protein [Fimicolochytrium jonesii]|uniref:ribosomal protein S5 domain 2-type protein n=1 Tax=Fimicolochytrium jonesii TaxID=1396493 RepID=UPI0022FE0A1E|nr:ribosomal protein S5 domain 2-type protein [Fimicolochytrium jonesii]KAI8819376.1 ribosomal protein S5 domain 2-type protein [Fimicolochytrium jonesii]
MSSATLLADETVPSLTRLEDVYPANVLDFQRKRYQTLQSRFEARFKAKPHFFARSPGRVNLIGEHVDYSGYSVLPMAIDRDVVIAVRVLEDSEKKGDSGRVEVVLANTDEQFGERTFSHDKGTAVEIDSTLHDWSNYFKCGYKGVFENAKNLDSRAPLSFHALIDGSVPAGGGVSSSSAFTCASALATLEANKGRMTKGELTNTAIKGERYAGVQCGGMDQAISIMAPMGSPLIIHFEPKLSADRISFPVSTNTSSSPVFVVTNTLVVSNKVVTAPIHYNLRVVETRLAAALLNKHVGGADATTDAPLLTLRDIQDRYVRDTEFTGNETAVLAKLSALTDTALKREPYTLPEVATLLNTTVDAVKQRYIGPIVIGSDEFHLHARAKHVYEESRRVFQFRDTCAQIANTDFNPTVFLTALGDLMNASQDSCRDLYDCSCDEINDLTRIAREAGAYGSRLTGAGWGGCVVSLVAESEVESFIGKVREAYYDKRRPDLKGKDAEMEDYVFASKPGGGAAVVRL